MIALIIATVCAALFSVLFKIFKSKNIDTIPAIVYNYLTAVVLSLMFSYNHENGFVNPIKESWFIYAILAGLIFFSGMMVLSYSTIKAGVVISTVCSRASMVIPIFVTYLCIPGTERPNWVAIVIMILAMFLIVWKGKSSNNETRQGAWSDMLLPLLVLVMFGLSNTCMKLMQYSISSRSDIAQELINQNLSMVTFTIFLSAMFIGVLTTIFSKEQRLSMLVRPRNILGGIALGTSNFLCTYTLMVAMKSITSHFLFPVHNFGVVALGALVGWGFYHEKMKVHQIVGFVTACITIFFL